MHQLIVLFICIWIATPAALAGKVELLGGVDEITAAVGLAPHNRDVSGAIIFHALQDDIAVDPRRQIVKFSIKVAPGTIIVKTKSRQLFLVMGNGKAIRYPVGVGREGFAWSGRDTVSRKSEWPDWRPPQEMIEREAAKGHIIPTFMKGGESNPLGARALYIGSTAFRIHGTTQPKSIGHAVSSGCIRMLNDHVIDLYDRVKVGARVIVE